MKKKSYVELLKEFSIPLIAGVLVAIVWANASPAQYAKAVFSPFVGPLSLHFLTNDLFMVFFFAIAAVEIVQSCLPGGDLHPLRKAVNPLLSTLGGVIGPAAIYLGLAYYLGAPALARGWGIPTATDIALAWLVGRAVFGQKHPAISFLLLLAIVDDGVGLAIIAIFYPSPELPVVPSWLALTLIGMAAAYGLRRLKVRNYWPYVLLGGAPSWAGLFMAHLHPALALVFIVPFMPHPRREHAHIFEADQGDRSTLAQFQKEWKVIVDFGLFLFGLCNAGVEFAMAGTATWLVLASLVAGKTIGVFTFGKLAEKIGFPLPDGIKTRELFVMGLVAGIGFTVALFVSGEAFVDPALRAQAKMGAMASLSAGALALIAGKLFGIGRSAPVSGE